MPCAKKRHIASCCGPFFTISALYEVSAKKHKEVLVVCTSYRNKVLAVLTSNHKEVLAACSIQAQVATRSRLLADAKRSSCVCIIFGLYSTKRTHTKPEEG